MFNLVKKLFKKINQKLKKPPADVEVSNSIVLSSDDSSIDNEGNIDTYNLKIHPDLDGLLWFGDGPLQNYDPEETTETFNINEFLELKISFSGDIEPSCIFLSSPIKPVNKAENVDAPGYFPSYKYLNPEQRYLYGLSLINPYNPNIDISYIFILYYGLERYLFTDKYEKAFDIILKLKEVHKNNSFQSYSTNALFLCSLMYKRRDLFDRLVENMTIETIDSKKYLFTKIIFQEPLNAREIIKLSREVDFKNMRYIDSDYDLFVESLEKQLINQYGISQFPLNNYDLNNSKTTFTSMLANYSLPSNVRTFELPDPLSIPNLKKDIYTLIESTHKNVKLIVEARRVLDADLAKNDYAVNLCAFTVAQLKDILKKYNLPLSGNKYELIVRIIDNIDENNIDFPE